MKKGITVHASQNEETKNFRYYNQFWVKFIDYLKTKFDVTEDTYFVDANRFFYNVNLFSQEAATPILECEMIIENNETHEFVVMSVSDVLTASILNHNTNPKCKKIIFSQFDEPKLKRHLHGEKSFEKYSPWIYFPTNIFDIDKLYEQRKNIKEFVDKFCFWGTSLEERSILSHFDKNYIDWGPPIGEFDNYAKKLITYKAALSISGRAEFCYRDVENFGLGTSILRFEYINKMFNPLIPNYHYISVDRPDELSIDRLGTSEHAQLLVNRFIEVKDNIDFLNYISNNARKYYEENLTMENSIKLTYNILKLNEWE